MNVPASAVKAPCFSTEAADASEQFRMFGFKVSEVF
jgi:hypothetical protein